MHPPKRHTPLCLLALLILCMTCMVGCSPAPSAPAELIGEWIYASAESEGSTSHVSGSLKLDGDGKFEESRYIGTIGGFRKGGYTVKGATLTLTDESSQQAQTFEFTLGKAKDVEDKPFPTLLLQGAGLNYLLTKKP